MISQNTRKTFTIRPSGRSTDFIAPSFGFGCLYDCGYCYMKRHKDNKDLSVAKNANDILTSINNHVTWLDPKEPNQTDSVYYTYDISCNEDFALHAKYHKWEYIFDFFRTHPRAKASLATKTVPKEFLSYDPKGKVRIRFSLMPQKLSSVLEPNTAQITKRIKAIDTFINAGYDVHINFSPIIVYQDWLKDYRELFEEVNKHVKHKDLVKSECIFLTHNKDKHVKNINRPGEDLLWTPSIQENKTSQYGGKNIRYKNKSSYINSFKKVYNEVIPWCTIRYIF